MTTRDTPLGLAGRAVAGLFDAAGVTGSLHAVDLDTGESVEHRSGASVVMASVFKTAVLVALLREVDAGSIDLTERVVASEVDRTPGPTGLSVLHDPVEMSVRDLATMMIVVSDNEATDLLLNRVGVRRVNDALEALGCRETVVVHTVAQLLETIVRDAGLADFGEFASARPSAEQLDSWRALRPHETNRTTARDSTRLLAEIWKDQAASPASCALARTILGHQVWPHRLAAGFPEDDVATAGKTGTLPRIRNEAGVVTYPDGGRYAVAVFTTSRATAVKNPAADAVIGRAARVAVDALRAVHAVRGGR